MNKKLLALVISVIMLVSLMSTVVFAADTVSTEADLKAAFAAGGDIVLGADIPVTGTLELPEGKNLTLDLNGYTISGTAGTGSNQYLIEVRNTATLTVKDSGTDGTITYAGVSGTADIAVIWVEGKLVLESGIIELTGNTPIGFAVDVYPSQWETEYTEPTVFEMNDGKIQSAQGAVRVTSFSSDTYESNVEFTMNDGELASGTGYYTVNIQVQDDAPNLDVNINGGTLTAADSSYPYAVYLWTGNGLSAENVEIELAGGTYNGDVMFNPGTSSLKEENVSVTGGTYNGTYGVYYWGTNSFKVVSGGTFTSDWGWYYTESFMTEDSEFIENADGSKEVVVPVEVTVKADPEQGGTVTGEGTYYAGKDVTVTATAKEGYEFVGWYENDDEVSAEASYTFEAEEDTTLVAKFKVKEAASDKEDDKTEDKKEETKTEDKKEEVKNPPTGSGFSPALFVALQVMALAVIGAMLAVNKVKNIK